MAMWWQCEATCAHELVHHHLFLKFTIFVLKFNLLTHTLPASLIIKVYWLTGCQSENLISVDQLPPIFAIGLSLAIERRGQFRPKLPFPANVAASVFFSPRIAAAATFLCFNIRLSLNCTSLCVTLSLWLYITVSVCRAASWPHLITNRFQPRPALPHTAGGRRGSLRDG